MLRRVQVHVTYPIQLPVLSVGFPGQQGNPVGFASAPGWPGAFQNGTGIYSGLANPTNLPALAASTISGISGGGVIISGPSPSNPTIISYLDFDSAGSNFGEHSISTTGGDGGPALSNVTFLGCRFQSNNVLSFSVECFKSGSNNITFSYCSMTPRVATSGNATTGGVASPGFSSPPGVAWPSNSAGTGTQFPGVGFGIPYLSGYLQALNPGNGIVTADHCDMWGGACYGNIASGSTQQITFTDNWVHDFRFEAPPSWNGAITYNAGELVLGSDGFLYSSIAGSNTAHNPVGGGGAFWNFIQPSGDHTDGIGYYTGGAAPSNVLLRHNTIAGIGNTSNISLQDTTTQYVNWVMQNNYLSGNNNSIEGGFLHAGNAGLVFTDNIIATDLAQSGNIVIHASAGNWRANGNLWRRNKLKIFPNDTWSGWNAWDGFFIWPDGSGPQALGPGSVLNTVDFS